MVQDGKAAPPQQRRLDARRNRDRILRAARSAFADPDADVSMADIARRSGIGSATLYRNFADRRALLEALYGEEIDAICKAAESPGGATGGADLEIWLRRFYDYFTAKRVLARELLKQTDSESPVFRDGFARVVDAADPLVAAARTSGELRADLTLQQLLALVASVANIPGDESFRRPILSAILSGMFDVTR